MSSSPMSAAAWAESIAASWRQSVASIIETGRLLNKAKDVLPHGQFGPMTAGLPFGQRTAELLMELARCPRFEDPNHGAIFPPSWRTLHAIAKLSDEDFAVAVQDGVIRPDMERRDIERFVSDRRIARQAQPPKSAASPAPGPDNVRNFMDYRAKPASAGKSPNDGGAAEQATRTTSHHTKSIHDYVPVDVKTAMLHISELGYCKSRGLSAEAVATAILASGTAQQRNMDGLQFAAEILKTLREMQAASPSERSNSVH